MVDVQPVVIPEGILPEQLLTSTAEALLSQKKEVKNERFPTGPIDVVHAFWIAGMSCDGCSVAATGATNPSVESLLTGSIAQLPKLVLHHPVLSVEAGHGFIRNFELAAEGKLGAPYVVVFEGSVANENLSASTGGYWAGLGAREVNGEIQQIPSSEWLERLAPGAAAVIAIGTCATWGGVPAAIGNPTGSVGVMDHLEAEYRSDLGLPVINIPGCSPIGDNFTEVVATVLLFLQGMGPLPEFDELGRPAWLYGETVHRGCTRAGYYEEGVFAEEYGDKECLVEIGCWGPVVNCNIVSRGAINHMGGCMATGGICIGCTMPGFPDAFAPFYKRPPGTAVSSTASKMVGGIIRNLRKFTKQFADRTRQWGEDEKAPSGWGHIEPPNDLEQAGHKFYEQLQFGNGGKPVGHVKFSSLYESHEDKMRRFGSEVDEGDES